MSRLPTLPSPRMAAAILVLTVAGCGGGDATGPGTDEDGPGNGAVDQNVFMALTSDLEVWGRPGVPLARPVVAQVVDQAGNPRAVAGVAVAWTVTAGGGTVSGPSTTDASGRAEGAWTLGTSEGLQRLNVSVGTDATREVKAIALDPTKDRPVVYMENPEGSYIPGGKGTRLVLAGADGKSVTPLTHGSYPDKGPRWSPDGTRIAFVRQFTSTCSTLQGDIMVFDLTALTLTRLTEDGDCSAGEFVDWSPDGKALAFERGGDIAVLTLSDRGRRTARTAAGRAGWVAWGPAGIAFSWRATPQDAFRIYLTDPVAATTSELLGDGVDDYNPVSWSRDGASLTVFRKSPSGAAAPGFSVGTYTVSGASFSPIQGTEGSWWGTWSPDGSTFLVTVRGSGIGECPGQFQDYVAMLTPGSATRTPWTPRCGTPSGGTDWRSTP